MPLPASLHACRQPVRGHYLLRSECAWGHEVWFFSRPRKVLADIVIGLLETVEQERSWLPNLDDQTRVRFSYLRNLDHTLVLALC